MLGLATKKQKNFLKVNLALFFLLNLFRDTYGEDDLASLGPSSFKVQFIKPCLPKFEIENKLTWEEKTENGLIRGESSFTLAPPLEENTIDVKLPKHPHLKQFSLEINLMGDDVVKCKINSLKNLKIDTQEAFEVQRRNICACNQ